MVVSIERYQADKIAVLNFKRYSILRSGSNFLKFNHELGNLISSLVLPVVES